MYRILVIFICLFFLGARTQVQGKTADAYLILYATHEGKTGHAGLALDKQRIRVIDCATCPGGVTYDTVKTGELVYFDLWPGTDDWTYSFFFGAVDAHYYRLPTSHATVPITALSLMRKGLPHAMEDACDGLIKIPITPTQNAELIEFLQGQIDANRPFSLYEFNCSDFVLTALRKIFPDLPDAKEKVLARQATTPNRLWHTVACLPGVEILKDPGDKTAGSFNAQRIFSILQPVNNEN